MGPLTGLRVIELGGIGPTPFCSMLLADLGATVTRIERASASPEDPSPVDCLLRNRHSIALNFKNPAAAGILLRLVEQADTLLEGFRPGVTERLGIGPEKCLAHNPKLVYGRMTGWGQEGPLSQTAGHDINYIALCGALHMIGQPGGKPVPPLNLVGDMGGGGMMLAFGVLAAVFEAQRSGKGQVVDAAMIDGAISQMGIFFAMNTQGVVRDATGEDMLAGGAPWYDTYATRDGKYVAIGAIEPQFYRLLLKKLQLDVERFAPLGYPNTGPEARSKWPELRAAMATAFAARTQAEWCAVLEGTDVCFSPVLSLGAAPEHPHHVARKSFITVDGVPQNAPAPRFSRTPAGPVRAPRRAGEDTKAVLTDAGYTATEISDLRSAGVLV
jgi:alpha-methylacyl-CoA racemase